MRWFEKHLPKDGSVRIHRFDQTLVGLSIAGPKSQALLQKLVDEDVSTKAFRFMDFREMAVGGAPCMVNRVTYTGDLGYEIWMQPAYQRLVYKAIKDAGEEFGIVDFGMRALLSMRLEKNFPTWFARAPADLRAVRGRAWTASSRWRRTTSSAATPRPRSWRAGPKLRRVSLVVEAIDADVMGDEPIWAKVDGQDYGTVEKPHGYGAPRFDAAGKAVRGSTAAHRRIRGARHHRRRMAGGRLGDLGRLRAPCRQVAGARLRAGRRWPRMRATACSRSRFSATAAPPASMSSRCSIRPARRCGGRPRVIMIAAPLHRAVADISPSRGEMAAATLAILSRNAGEVRAELRRSVEAEGGVTARLAKLRMQ